MPIRKKNKKTVASYVNQQITWTLPFHSIPPPEHARGDSGEENSLLTGRNLKQKQTQKGRPFDHIFLRINDQQNIFLKSHSYIKYL